MTIAEIQNTGPDNASSLSKELIQLMPLILRSAALVALLALAATVDWGDARSPDQQADLVTSEPGGPPGPVFDGRGKWGGYAR